MTSELMTPPGLPEARRIFERARLRLAALQGQERELAGRRDALARTIALAKARVELAPDAVGVLDFLQARAHKRAVGAFENLLSAFVADVVPEAGTIKLTAGTERGAPALDIHLDNAGNPEDILDGNGGGLTNVVVAGLVYAAQARTNTRPLVVLDEPDCWLKATRVPAFTKVIADVANPRVDEHGARIEGVQTLMISHNDISLMDPGAHILALADDADGIPFVTSMSGEKPWDNDEQVGVRWVEVECVRRHLKSRAELSPGLNVMAGDINGGKSTLFVTGFRAMAYGETDDTMIQHGADRMVVRMGLEKGVVLEMVRVRKGSPKVIYRRYQDGVLVNEGAQERRGSVPEFITEVLRIERVDDLDIQLRSQKQPIFLLDEPASRRAQLLSVGRESGLLHAVMERHRLNLKRDREAIRRDEAELATLNKKLDLLHPLMGLKTLCDILDGLATEAADSSENVAKLAELLRRLVRAEKMLSLTGDAPDALPVAPVVVDTRKLDLLSTNMARNSNLASLATPTELPVLPVIAETRGLRDLATRLGQADLVCRLADVASLPSAPAVVDTKPLDAQCDRLDKADLLSRLADVTLLPTVPVLPDVKVVMNELNKQTDNLTVVAKFEQHLAAAKVAEKAAETEHTNLLVSIGVCPLCNTPFTEEHKHAA